jgi:hypothetical protein
MKPPHTMFSKPAAAAFLIAVNHHFRRALSNPGQETFPNAAIRHKSLWTTKRSGE